MRISISAILTKLIIILVDSYLRLAALKINKTTFNLLNKKKQNKNRFNLMMILEMIMIGETMYKYRRLKVLNKSIKVSSIDMILDFRVHYIVIIEIIIRLKRLPPLILIHKSDLNNLLLSLLLRRTKLKSQLWEILI